jgi:hypothetical protein
VAAPVLRKVLRSTIKNFEPESIGVIECPSRVTAQQQMTLLIAYDVIELHAFQHTK